MRSSVWWWLVLASLFGCAEGTGDGLELDGNPPGDGAPGDNGTDDKGDDKGDAGFELDLPDAQIDPVDAVVASDALADVGSDTPLSPELDVPAPTDVAVTPDAAPPVDLPVATDTPVGSDAPPTDSGSTCSGGAAEMCGAACVHHDMNPLACGAAENLGAYCGDATCTSPLCPSTRYRTVATRTGRTSMWFGARAVECSLCSATILARVNLAVPAGTDYDLYVHRPCGALLGSSQRSAGMPEQVEASGSDRPITNESYDYFIEVRYVSGSSCEPWTLTLEARGPNATDC